MDNDKQKCSNTTMPKEARLCVNRCNLPAVILGSLIFQQKPSPLYIDGVTTLHADLFKELDKLSTHKERAEYFIDYVTVHFRLHLLGEAGFSPNQRFDRSKANYQRVLRGWAFNPDGQEAAILKGWVESRFGLIPRFHETAISSIEDESYHSFQQHYANGIYNTNALEAQLDLIYSYCQYELQQQQTSHLTLYRGSNLLEELQQTERCKKPEKTILLNNINSFSRDQERADEFGDTVIKVEVPKEKVFFYSELLPGCLKGEAEVMVLGGVYCARKVW